MIERRYEHLDLLEYFAALSPWAIYNTNRGRNTPFHEIDEFMYRRKWRLGRMGKQVTNAGPSHTHTQRPMVGTPARVLAPVPESGMRWAMPGERPASKLKPGEKDDVIERFDAYRAAYFGGRVKHGG